MTNTIIKKKIFILLIISILILVPFAYAEVVSDTYSDSSGKPLGVGSTTTPSTTPPAATPSTTPLTTPKTTPTTTNNPLDWIKSNSKGVEIKETRGLYGIGKVTGAVATFQNPDSVLKYKDSSGTEQTISGVLPKTDTRKAEVTFNPDGSIKDIKLTADPKATKPLSLNLENTKLEIPQGATLDYNKDNNKAVVGLKGGVLSQMPQQIDNKKKDGLRVSYQAEETTQLPNGIVLEKAEKSFSKSTIDSIDGKDYISIGNTARLNGINAYNIKYKDNVNEDTEILGLRGKVSKTDLSSGMTAKDNYILIDVKNKVFETGAGKGKTGLVINMNNENDFITGVKENGFFAYQPRNGGILQVTKQGNNLPSLIDTSGEFIFGSGTHNYYYKGNGKILVDSIPGIPGLGFDRSAKDIASVPFMMKNHDSSGKDINKGYMIVSNDNNGWAMVPVGTTQAQLSNGDTWRSSLYDRVSPPSGSSVGTPAQQPTTPGSSCNPGTPGCVGGKCGPNGCGGVKPIPGLNPGYIPQDTTTNPDLSTLPEQTDNSNGPKTTSFNPDRNNGGYSGIEGDVISHTRPGTENTGMTEYGPGGARTITISQTDAMTGTHEMEHDVNSRLRNEKGVQGYWGFYTGNNEAVYIKQFDESKVNLDALREEIPQSLRGSRYNTYIAQDKYEYIVAPGGTVTRGNKINSLYSIFDESWTYHMGSQAALETGSGSVTGLSDTTAFALASAKVIYEKDPNYWNSADGTQFKGFLKQTIQQNMDLLKQGISTGKIDNVEQQRIFANLRTSPDAEKLRQFTRDNLDATWTKQVLGF